MDDNELREMDVKVHKALHPGATFDTYIAPSGKREPESYQDGFPTGEVPHYSTDIGAWEPVYALKPEWRWTQNEHDSAVWVTLFPGDAFFATVWPEDATGLAAYALGRARCVLQWAEAQHGG